MCAKYLETAPKVKPVTKIADLRPISVTPVFSRITERLVKRLLLVIAVTDEHTLFTLVLCRRSVKNDIIHFRILAGI